MEVIILLIGVYIAYATLGKFYRVKRAFNYVLPKAQYRKQYNYHAKNGAKYEAQIGKMLQNKGYKVYFKGINEGFSDGGIDLIAYKGREVLLVQCKNWEYSQVKQEHLRIFLGDCTAYIEQNSHKLRHKDIRRVFVTSCEGIDYGVKKFLESSNISYWIVPYRQG